MVKKNNKGKIGVSKEHNLIFKWLAKPLETDEDLKYVCILYDPVVKTDTQWKTFSFRAFA